MSSAAEALTFRFFFILLMYNGTMCLVVILCVPGHVEGTPSVFPLHLGRQARSVGMGHYLPGRAHHRYDSGLASIELPESRW